MRVHLIAVGTRMPAWVATGFEEYARRMPPHCAVELREVAVGPRGQLTPPARIREEEGERLLAAVPARAVLVALDERGEPWTTEALARRLGDWLAAGRDLALLVGGAEGLSPACQARAAHRWSLSPLTLPHMLVRVIVAEQLYRAWSVLAGHPYHRAGEPASRRRPRAAPGP